MDPHWDDVRIFLAVARHESLSAAGRVLKIDPATVGRRVSRLESAFGVPLFVKSPQGYALSEAGERFLAHGEAAEQAMRAATETLDGQSEGMTGQMRIGAPDGCANYLLPQVCARLGRDNPDLDIQIVALPRVVNLSRREADMAVAVSAPTAGQLLVKRITDYKLHLVATRRYLRNHPPLESLEDLRGRRMVGYIPDMIFDAELDYLDKLGIRRVPLASNSVPVQLKLLCQHAGLGIAHDFSLPAHRTLCKVLKQQISLTRSFYLVRHQADQRSQRLNRFAEALASGLRDEVIRLEALT
ncbi:LysR family transcriptional regulator [Microbulbifer sp. S227A]|uniref:LysR family transcriptional regulator n=1 Tax=Microbulbifer sp. S227A TaxID=3415131 RepID=UPI003C798C44